MKKTLVALAALASVSAFAQSSVSISGTFDGGYATYDVKGNRFNQVNGSGSSATTALIFSGVEDIGGGVAGVFNLEIDPNLADTSNRTAGTSATGTSSNTPSSLGNGQAFVGANTPYGNIKFGTPNSATLSINGDANSGFATAIGSGYRVTSFDAVRFQNSLRYDTPVIAGFSASYLLSAKNDKQANSGYYGLNGNLQNQNNGRDEVKEIGLTYANGPLTARYASLEVNQFAKARQVAAADYLAVAPTWAAANGGNFKLNSVSVKYAVNQQLTVAYFNQTIESTNLVGASTTSTAPVFDRKTNGLSAAYDVTPVIKVLANYQKSKNGSLSATATAGTANAETTVTGLGVDYALSKRTTAFFRMERDADGAALRDTTGYTAATGNTTYKAQAFGLRHTF